MSCIWMLVHEPCLDTGLWAMSRCWLMNFVWMLIMNCIWMLVLEFWAP